MDGAGRNMLELDMVLLNEGFGVGRCDFGSLPQEGIESTKLREADGRVDIGHSIVLADQRMEVLDARVFALVTKDSGEPSNLLVVREDHPALDARHHLRRVEAQGRHAAMRQEALSVVRSPEGVRSVFDQGEPILAADFIDSITIRRQATVIDGHERLRARTQARSNRLGIDVEGLRVDIGQDRGRALIMNGIRGSDVG